MAREQADRAFAAIDSDGDGVITQQEFRSALTEQPEAEGTMAAPTVAGVTILSWHVSRQVVGDSFRQTWKERVAEGRPFQNSQAAMYPESRPTVGSRVAMSVAESSTPVALVML